MSTSVMARRGDLGAFEDRAFTIANFRLLNSAEMPPAANGRDALLITHGYTSSHHPAGRNPSISNQSG
jgi:hypothetical protein